MGFKEWVQRKLEKDPDEDIDVDPSEKVGVLSVKLAALYIIMFIVLAIEAYYGYVFTLGMPTTIILMTIIVVITTGVLAVVVMEKRSLLIVDTSGMSGPIRKDDPIPLNIGTPDGTWKVRWSSQETDDKGEPMVTYEQEYGFDVYRAGLSYFFHTHRPGWYMVPRIIRRVLGYDGRERIINYGAWKRSPIRLDVNGALHKYKRLRDVPEPFRSGLRAIPGFKPKRHWVRASYFPDVDYSQMDRIKVPVEVIQALDSITKERDTYRRIEAETRGTAEGISRSHKLAAEKGDLRPADKREPRRGYYGDYYEGE